MPTEHPHEIRTPIAERTPWASRILVPEMWGGAAIAVMWLAVLFVGVFGPSIVWSNLLGNGDVPVVVMVSFIALLDTVPVARWAFRSRRD